MIGYVLKGKLMGIIDGIVGMGRSKELRSCPGHEIRCCHFDELIQPGRSRYKTCFMF